MDESIALSAVASKLVFGTDPGCLKREKELLLVNQKLTANLERLQERLSFVEVHLFQLLHLHLPGRIGIALLELIGPTESQRKTYQVQLTSARDAALRVAHSCAGSIPTRCVGRLDEGWLRSKGLSDQECSMLQRGCVAGDSGVPCDISMLGDPSFSPYDKHTFQPRWEAKGGFLQLSLGDVRDKWGEEVALEVVRCAIELDRHDASRRLGVELPWNEKEDREMDAAEVIGLLGQQLVAAKCCGVGAVCDRLTDDEEESEWGGLPRSEAVSPADGEGGRSRAWSMLEAMMNDLGLNARTSTSAPTAPTHLQATGRTECHGAEEPDTDDEVVQEALEEQGLAEEAAEQDIQQLLREPPSLLLSSPLTPAQPTTQQKTSTSRNMLTSSRAETPCSGSSAQTRGVHTLSSNTTIAASSSPALEAGMTLAIAHEASANETLFLQLLEDEVGGSLNLCLPGSGSETSGATSPLSSLPSP